MKFAIKAVAASVILASAGGAFAQKGETVKIAWLDPLSGLMAAVGTNQLKSFQFIAEEFNKKNPAGVKFEIIGIDNKLSPQETTSALRSASAAARAWRARIRLKRPRRCKRRLSPCSVQPLNCMTPQATAPCPCRAVTCVVMCRKSSTSP